LQGKRVELFGDGSFLRAVRLACRHDPDEFAEALSRELGWPVPTAVLLAWETGKSLPPPAVLRAARTLAEARRPAGILAASRDRLRLTTVEFSSALAPLIGRSLDEAMVPTWEAGFAPAPDDVVAAALMLAPSDVQAIVRSSDDAKLDPMDRRRFLLAVVGLVTGLEPWERLSFALRHPGRVDQATVDQLEAITIALEGLEPVADPRALLDPVTRLLNALATLLASPLRPTVRRELSSLAGEAAGIAGRLRWIMDDDLGATAYYETGMEAAREAGDAALGAYLVGKAACKPFYREDPAGRLRRLEGALGFTPAHASPRTGAWLAMLEAEAHALMADSTACSRALDRATSALDTAGTFQGERRPRVDFFDAAWLTGQRGACLGKIGKTAEARDALTASIDAQGAAPTKQRTWLLAMLAGTYAHDGEPEEACRYGSMTLSSAVTLGSKADFGLVDGLLHDLSNWRLHPAVQTLDDELRQAGATN